MTFKHIFILFILFFANHQIFCQTDTTDISQMDFFSAIESIVNATDEEISGCLETNITIRHRKNINWEKYFKAFAKLPYLRELTIEYCDLEDLPFNISKLKKLKTLSLSYNKLKKSQRA